MDAKKRAINNDNVNTMQDSPLVIPHHTTPEEVWRGGVPRPHTYAVVALLKINRLTVLGGRSAKTPRLDSATRAFLSWRGVRVLGPLGRGAMTLSKSEGDGRNVEAQRGRAAWAMAYTDDEV
jgi:hypothetical protein